MERVNDFVLVKNKNFLTVIVTSAHLQEYFSVSELFFFLLHYSFLLQDNETTHKTCTLKTSHFLVSQENRKNGTRYLDPKYSRWISTYPALEEYMSVSDAGCGGAYNPVNMSLYHYAGNNPVKYTDPDGKFIWVVVPIIIGFSVLFTSDKQPSPTPVNADGINKKLANIFYDDPSIQKGNVLTSPYGKENSKSLVLESHPILALSGALPRGSYSEGDYVNPNQLKGKAIENLETTVGGIGLAATIVENLSKGHLGDVTLTYKTDKGKVTSWLMTLTTINPLTGDTSGRQVFSREEALKYLNDNKEVLKNDPAYKELVFILD